MARHPDVDLRQRPPGSAHHVERLALAFARPFHLVERLGDERPQRTAIPLAHRIQPQRTDRQRYAVAHLAARHADQFQAAAAQIADHAIGKGNARNQAHCGAARFGLAIDHLDCQTAFGSDPIDERLPILRLAHCGGGDGSHVGDAHRPHQRGKAVKSGHGHIHGVVAQPPIGRDPTTQPGHDFLVEHRFRHAGATVVDDKPDRITADVDDGAAVITSRCRHRA